MFDKRVHAATRLTLANRADDCDSGEKPALRDDEPTRCFRGDRITGIVNLPDHEKHVLPLARVRVPRQASCGDLSVCLQREDVEAGKKGGIHDVGRREKEQRVGPLRALKNEWGTDRHKLKEWVAFREWNVEIERHAGSGRENEGDKML